MSNVSITRNVDRGHSPKGCVPINTHNTHSVHIRRTAAKRPLAIIVTIIMLISSVVPIMAMADSSNGGGRHF
jgi:hypothetical protein